MSILVGRMEDFGRTIPPGAIRHWNDDDRQAYTLTMPSDPYHGTHMLLCAAEFYDGKTWRPIAEWDAWRAIES